MLSATSNGRQSRSIIQLLSKGLTSALTGAILLSGSVPANGNNVLPNGGFEIDINQDGVADRWIAKPYKFDHTARQDAEVTASRVEEMLRENEIKAVGDWVMWRKNPGEKWPTKFIREYILMRMCVDSRFGRPEATDAELGRVTCVVQTLVVLGTEFGCRFHINGNDGRDHHDHVPAARG